MDNSQELQANSRLKFLRLFLPLYAFRLVIIHFTGFYNKAVA